MMRINSSIDSTYAPPPDAILNEAGSGVRRRQSEHRRAARQAILSADRNAKDSPRLSKALRTSSRGRSNMFGRFKNVSPDRAPLPSLRDYHGVAQRSDALRNDFEELTKEIAPKNGRNENDADTAKWLKRQSYTNRSISGGYSLSDAEAARRLEKHKAKQRERQKGGSKLRAQRKHEAKLEFDRKNAPQSAKVATPEESENARRIYERQAEERAARIVAQQREQYRPSDTENEGNGSQKGQALKKAGIGLLAVGGTAAAALAVRHIAKKRAERKRREREEEAKRKAHWKKV